MYKNCVYILILVFCFLNQKGISQDVKIKNRSFEGIAKQGGRNDFRLDSWEDCGAIDFPAESAPDIHPASDTTFWENNIRPSDGSTYVGMVVRINETWESITQKLDEPLDSDKCYFFSVDLVRSANYWSGVNPKAKDAQDLGLTQNQKYNYVTPVVLRVWGGHEYCQRAELLLESNPIDNIGWHKNYFKFKPKEDYQFVVFEAFYKVPVPFPYLGHLLMDNASDFIEANCPDKLKDIIAYVQEKNENQKEQVVFKQEKKEKKIETEVFVRPQKKEVKKDTTVFVRPKPKTTKKPKILKDLDRKTIKEGQTILIKNLVFEADTTSMNKESEIVIKEMYEFLDYNREIHIEFGGHTNGICEHVYCDDLSRKRAQKVADILIEKGIDKNRITVKGYGKRNPIASNFTPEGRKKNQRVEIKIIKIN